jgi:hypothetical protein
MRTIFLFIAIAMFAGCTNAQKVKEADVPQAVKAKFQSQFPTATGAKWEKENADYEVNFNLGKVETSAVIDANGNLKETEAEIEVSDLPAAINTYITTNYPGYKIGEAAKTTDANNVVTYEAEVSKAKDKFDLIFDASGNFVKKVVEKDEEKD